MHFNGDSMAFITHLLPAIWIFTAQQAWWASCTLARRTWLLRRAWLGPFEVIILWWISWLTGGEEFYTNKLLSYLNGQKVMHHFHTGERDKQTTSIPVLGTKQVWRKIGRVVKWNENVRVRVCAWRLLDEGPCFLIQHVVIILSCAKCYEENKDGRKCLLVCI